MVQTSEGRRARSGDARTQHVLRASRWFILRPTATDGDHQEAALSLSKPRIAHNACRGKAGTAHTGRTSPPPHVVLLSSLSAAVCTAGTCRMHDTRGPLEGRPCNSRTDHCP